MQAVWESLCKLLHPERAHVFPPEHLPLHVPHLLLRMCAQEYSPQTYHHQARDRITAAGHGIQARVSVLHTKLLKARFTPDIEGLFTPGYPRPIHIQLSKADSHPVTQGPIYT